MNYAQRIAGAVALALVAACGGGDDSSWGSSSTSSSKVKWYKNCRWDYGLTGNYLYYHCVATTACNMSDVCSGFTEGISGCQTGDATCEPY